MQLPVTQEHSIDLFENLETLCRMQLALPGVSGRIRIEDTVYEGRDEFDRLMGSQFEILVEWGSERLA